MIRFLNKYFRKDNRKFIVEFLLSLFGFAVSNISLITLNNYLNVLTISLCCVSLLCFVCMMTLIFHKYKYYRGLVEHLQRKNKQLFLICSYISKIKKYRNKEKTNNVTVNNVNIIYDIDVPSVFNDKESDIDFCVTYEINAINSGAPFSKIYHFSLSKNNSCKILAECQFDKENIQNMKVDSNFLSDSNLQLWYGIKSGKAFERHEPVNYHIKLTYNKGFHLMKDNYFLIDPQNYGRTIRKINVIIRSKGEELRKYIQSPSLTTYYNGLNTNDKDGQILFESINHDKYKSYFSHTIKPNTDDIVYVLEILPLFLSDENIK